MTIESGRFGGAARIMLPRDQAERRGVAALARLIEIGCGHSGQCRHVRRFLIGLYCGSDWPFDLTDLRCVDRAIQEDALAVLAMDIDGPSVEVHNRIPGTSEIIATWAAAAAAAEDSDVRDYLIGAGELPVGVVDLDGHEEAYEPDPDAGPDDADDDR